MKLDYLFNDRHFFTQMFRLALPITLQNLVLSSLNMVDTIMIGGLGENAIAGVGLANQYYFLLNLLLFGIVSGSSIFTAQYWGSKDIKSIRKILGICIITGGAGALIFTLVGLLFPEEIMGIFSKDRNVILLANDYLKIVLFSYVVMAVSFAYSFSLRSTGDVKTPLAVSVIALGTNTILNYLLIYGHFGFPMLGVAGAAVATVISRIIELALLLLAVYSRNTVLAASPRELFTQSADFVKQFFKVTLPVILNESMWGLGMTLYTIAYARMGTDVFASTNISGTVEKIVWVVFMGVGNACAVMIGNKIGSGDKKEVFLYAKRFAILGPAAAIAMSAFVIAISPWVLTPYKVSPAVLDYARKNLIVFCLFMWAKVFNYINVVGILRSGGDTTFCLLLDTGGVWLIGIPMAFVGGLVLQLPIYVVYALVQIEEVVKLIIGIPRLVSKKWINNLTAETGK
ncbi:MAG TPA: MATE family efflux transporter [Clostridia bacterium]|nr:MATE family efflux transporter [Clostridia bacterium]